MFAVVGAVNTVIAISGGIGRIANQTDLKEEFALYLYPVVATDPPSFEDASTLTQSTIIKIAVSKILLTGDTSNYETDTGVMYIPEFDVETAAKNIFGSSIEVKHQTVGHVQDLATYNSEKKGIHRGRHKPYPELLPRSFENKQCRRNIHAHR